MLMADQRIQSRQFGIIDLQGRFAGFSGAGNRPASLDIQGQVAGTEIFYSIQGNILASNAVVQNAVRALEDATGSITDRVMAAMEAADAAGGDNRCSCTTEPVPDAPCTSRTAHVAYIMAADPTDAVGTSHNDGTYAMYLSVTDQNITPDENANPVVTLRRRYDAWKRGSLPGQNRHPRGHQPVVNRMPNSVRMDPSGARRDLTRTAPKAPSFAAFMRRALGPASMSP
jgi:uncharacterized Ntn-hydrolase superfamily protein